MDGRDLMISERREMGAGRAGNSPRMRPLSAPSLQSICSGARHLRNRRRREMEVAGHHQNHRLEACSASGQVE